MSGGISATTVMAGVSMAATVAATAMSAVGSAQQSAAQAAAARNQSQAAMYQAQVAQNAQKVAEWQAADAVKRGEVAEEQRRTKTKLQIGAQRAALASMGADIGSGSNLDIIGDTAEVGEMDALTIRGNAQRDAYERKMVAATAGGDAAMQQFAGANLAARANSYESNSWIGVGANLISGASSVADKWTMYKSKGVFG